MVTFDINELGNTVINIGAVLAFVSAAYIGLRKWVQKAANEAAAAARVVQKQLKTSNGRTIAEYVESSTHQLEQLVSDQHSVRALLDALDKRLDQHIANREAHNS